VAVEGPEGAQEGAQEEVVTEEEIPPAQLAAEEPTRRRLGELFQR